MSSESQFGSDYSASYDALYSEKDYQAESIFITEVIDTLSEIKVEKVLSIGCGTCTPDILLARMGYQIHGVDLSPEMIALARGKIRREKLEDRITLQVGDTEDIVSSEEYDFAMALFNVAGYWGTNDITEKVFRNVSDSLKPGALFIFDGWYGPAVLKDRPTDKVKVVNNGENKITRTTEAQLNIEDNILDLNFHLIEIAGNEVIRETEENHPMRYWYLPELENMLSNNGLAIKKLCTPLELESYPNEDNWNFVMIAQKR